MEWKDLAPWIAIAITLVLSIITPLLTQIANNRFKLKQDKILHDKKLYEDKWNIYCEFAEKVGACLAFGRIEEVQQAGAIIHKMYLVMPESSWEDLDVLFYYITNKEFEKAKPYLKKLCEIASKILSKPVTENRKKQKSK